jgi:hypothetical protein
MKRYVVTGVFIVAVVLFACVAFAGPSRDGSYGKHIDKHIDRHWDGPYRPGVRIAVGVNRYGMRVEKYVLPPYPNRKGKLDIRW